MLKKSDCKRNDWREIDLLATNSIVTSFDEFGGIEW